MTVRKVVFLHGLAPKLVELVLAPAAEGFEVHAVPGNAADDEQVRAVNDADYLMIYRANPSDHVLRHCKKVRLIQLLAAGYDTLNVDLIHELKIPLANNGGANSWAVSDHTVLLMLALYRRLVSTDAQVRAGRWSEGIDGRNTFELADKVVGILGLGNIGKKVARRVQAFDATVQYHQPRRLGPELEQELGVRYCSLDELVSTSDILSLHAPLSARTRHIIDRNRLQSMKPGAVVINTGRGALIDETALVEALKQGRLAGAGLDAFEEEPIRHDSPLLELENVVLSPHSAGTTADTWRRRGAFAFANFQTVESGQLPDAMIHPHTM